ncbi:hypothetical protein DL96DRAFT_1624584 [Flagelloscypha sp. PMI_526]|nr:hypothetical protein DL96DRAFT_1624584 [Flagelloscypha sp. PMI_526]
MDRPDIKTAAQLFVSSYARAMHLSSQSDNLPFIASSLAAHYHPKTTMCFTVGHVAAWGEESVATHLTRFERSGLGFNIFIEEDKTKVDVLGDGNAMCWVTWTIRPKVGSGVDGWSWQNIYAFRRAPAGAVESEEKVVRIGGEETGWEKPEGWWEAIFGDNEILGVLERRPNFLEL